MWSFACGDVRAARGMFEACRATGMTAPGVCLVGSGHGPGMLRPPANWTLVHGVGGAEIGAACRMARAIAPDAGYYGILPAGHLPRTRGWDRALGAAAGRWNVAYSNDYVDGGRDPATGQDKATGAVAIGAGLVAALEGTMGGGAIPAGMTLAEARIAWVTIGRMLGLLRYRRDIVVERLRDPAAAVPEIGGTRFSLDAGRPDACGPDSCGPDSGGRARLFRWLNDEARPLARRVRERMAREELAAAERPMAEGATGEVADAPARAV